MATRDLIAPGGATGRFDPGNSAIRLSVNDGMSQTVATLAGAGIAAASLWCVYPQLIAGRLVRVLADYEVDDHSVL